MVAPGVGTLGGVALGVAKGGAVGTGVGAAIGGSIVWLRHKLANWMGGGGSSSPSGGSKSAGDILKENYKNGKAAEERVCKELTEEGVEVLGTQVSVRLRDGSKRIIDILAHDSKTKQIYAVEVKSGNAIKSAAQMDKDRLLRKYGGKLLGEIGDQVRGKLKGLGHPGLPPIDTITRP